MMLSINKRPLNNGTPPNQRNAMIKDRVFVINKGESDGWY